MRCIRNIALFLSLCISLTSSGQEDNIWHFADLPGVIIEDRDLYQNYNSDFNFSPPKVLTTNNGVGPRRATGCNINSILCYEAGEIIYYSLGDNMFINDLKIPLRDNLV